jgi:hypothetical protein
MERKVAVNGVERRDTMLDDQLSALLLQSASICYTGERLAQIRSSGDCTTSRSAHAFGSEVERCAVRGDTVGERSIANIRRTSEPDTDQQTKDSTEMEGECYALVTERGLHADILPGMSAELHENHLGTWGNT